MFHVKNLDVGHNYVIRGENKNLFINLHFKCLVCYYPPRSFQDKLDGKS